MKGHDIDALKIRIAIEIFGWKETDKRLPDHDPNWLEYEAPWFELPDGNIFHHTHMPDYPRKIADAWLVVEKVNQDNAFKLYWYNPDGRASYFSASFGFGIFKEASADTAPLAICLAAVEVE